MPSMKDVSICSMRARTRNISLRVFSKMTLGSSAWHRRTFGAITIAKLLMSILVKQQFSGAAKTCGGKMEIVQIVVVQKEGDSDRDQL